MTEEATCSRDGCNKRAGADTLIFPVGDGVPNHIFACHDHFVDPLSEYVIPNLSQVESEPLGLAYEECVLRSMSFENDSQRYTIVLQSTQSQSALGVVTGYLEAWWIRIIATKVLYRGPSTHALILSIIDLLDGKVTAAVVDGLDKRAGHYLCHLRISKRIGESVDVACRAEEAVAICLASGLPVTVDKALLCPAKGVQ